MVGADDLNLHALGGGAEILDRACFMRLSRITRTAVSAGEMKAQLERQPEILR
jgi:hypothetical protein